jgi:aspartate racemase
MKTIGLIGGMSWESSIEYYRIINETVRDRLGKLYSAQSIMYSVNFAEIEALQMSGNWDEATQVMIDAARRVVAGGADIVLICTNTMHLMADEVQAAIDVPLLHIVDAAAEAVKKQGLQKVALLGTRFTMEKDFYRGRLQEKTGIDVLIPNDEEREIIHRTIYDELVAGMISQESKAKFLKIIERLVKEGAQGVVLGCTEIPLLVKQEDVTVPVFDTMTIHATAAVDFALLD